IPVEIGNLSNLTSLYLGYNQLTSIPVEIGNLSSLTTLDLFWNQLISIPVEIANLSNLKFLSLTDNRLTAIPAEVGNISNLTSLYLGANQLTSIPVEIANLSNLTSLDLSKNQLTTIPVEIANLSNLAALSFLSNQLTAIPPEIANLPNLTFLNLSKNQLFSIPIEIANLSNLTSLNLSKNQLTTIPVEIVNLSNLEQLYLAWNRLRHIPAEIENLPNLKSLTYTSRTGSLNETLITNFDWWATQTVAPTEIMASPQSLNSIQLSWIPIAFQEQGGYYEVSLSLDGATFEVYQTITDQSIDTLMITGLIPESTYYIRMRTYSPASFGSWGVSSTSVYDERRNELWSEYSEVIAATTLPSSTGNHEPNDACDQATPIQSNGTPQNHTFYTANDADWLTFTAPTDGTYQVEVDIPENSPADVDLIYFSDCDTNALNTWDETFAPGVKLDIVAQAGQQFYLALSNTDSNIFGPDVRYDISVRKLPDEQPTGAVIILAGRLRANDTLQENINQTAEKVYGFFRSRGVSDDNILFLSTDPTLTGHDQMATTANLGNGITGWAKERVSGEQALTLYLIDHGERDLLYIDDLNEQYLSTGDLDAWLNELESVVPGLAINVIVEACHSGSFIDRANQSISKPNRVIVTSTSVESDAYASPYGIQFSDALITRLYKGDHLATAFWRAKEYAQIISEYQDPWLDGNGNGTPNEAEDMFEAGLVEFDYADPSRSSHDRIKWPPYIANAQPPTVIVNQQGTFQVEVRDDQGVAEVWAVVYPPDYAPPSSDDVLNTVEVLDRIPLQRRTALGTDMFDGVYAGFDQVGDYRVVVYATDADGLVAHPVVLTVPVTSVMEHDSAVESSQERTQRIFLPVVSR
ncbi:MAG: leucine-rich repeat domain-containing protein, partial [Chloroflexota bacterium]